MKLQGIDETTHFFFSSEADQNQQVLLPQPTILFITSCHRVKAGNWTSSAIHTSTFPQKIVWKIHFLKHGWSSHDLSGKNTKVVHVSNHYRKKSKVKRSFASQLPFQKKPKKLLCQKNCERHQWFLVTHTHEEPKTGNVHKTGSWWNQPIWKICASQNGWTSSPSFGVKIKNYLICHHLEKSYTNFWKCESIQLLIQNHLMGEPDILNVNFVVALSCRR